MKKISKLLSAAVLTAFALVGCINDKDDSTVDPYANIRPGLAIYNAGVVQNSLATDPATVAVRLAMLLEEAADQNKKIDELTVIFLTKEISLKYLLLGQSTTIEESEENPGEYRVNFIPSSPAILDPCTRDGAYLIRTGGIPLSEASETDAWSVEVASDAMYLYTGSKYTSSNFKMTGGQTRLWRREDGIYRFDLEQLAACFIVAPQFVSDWSGSFCWKPSTQNDDLTFKSHSEDSYSLYGQAQGGSFYSFNNTTATRMSYQVSETAPLVYEPTLTINAANPISGTETVELTDPADYSASDYPNPSVRAVYSVTDNMIYTTLHYNGVTQTL